MTIMAGIDSTTNKVENVKVTNGAAHVADGFKPSSYDANLTMDATGEALALILNSHHNRHTT